MNLMGRRATGARQRCPQYSRNSAIKVRGVPSTPVLISVRAANEANRRMVVAGQNDCPFFISQGVEVIALGQIGRAKGLLDA